MCGARHNILLHMLNLLKEHLCQCWQCVLRVRELESKNDQYCYWRTNIIINFTNLRQNIIDSSIYQISIQSILCFWQTNWEAWKPKFFPNRSVTCLQRFNVSCDGPFKGLQKHLVNLFFIKKYLSHLNSCSFRFILVIFKQFHWYWRRIINSSYYV